jgi:uncharacterized membrane protein
MPGMHLYALPELFRIEARRLVAWSRLLVHGTVFLLAVGVAILSYRYLFNLGPIPPNIAANRFRTMWLIVHAGFASTALLTGAIQFNSKLRRRWPTFHRRTGRIYGSSCLIGASAGLILAMGSNAGPIASAGFGSLAVAWFYSTWLGWQRARTGQFASHRRWMIRSWALTLSAVTLRAYLPLSEMSGLPELPAYRAISFLCWIPNILVAELLLRREAANAQRRLPALPLLAGPDMSLPQRAGRPP